MLKMCFMGLITIGNAAINPCDVSFVLKTSPTSCTVFLQTYNNQNNLNEIHVKKEGCQLFIDKMNDRYHKNKRR